MFKILNMTASTVLGSLMLFQAAVAEDIILHIPIISDSPATHFFFHELLEKALIEEGHNLVLISPELPQRRSQHFMSSGNISVLWMVESKRRN